MGNKQDDHREKGHAMDKLDRVETVRTKTGVSYSEAQEALEACGYDVLDAIVWLEQHGKTGTHAANYTTSAAPEDPTASEMSQAQSEYERSSWNADRFLGVLNRLLDATKRLLRKGVDTSFVADRHDQQVFSMPTLLLVLLLIFAFWVVLPLLIVGLFFDFRYHFTGIGTVSVNINDVVGKASDGAEAIKRNVKNAAEHHDSHVSK